MCERDYLVHAALGYVNAVSVVVVVVVIQIKPMQLTNHTHTQVRVREIAHGLHTIAQHCTPFRASHMTGIHMLEHMRGPAHLLH